MPFERTKTEIAKPDMTPDNLNDPNNTSIDIQLISFQFPKIVQPDPIKE